MPKLCPVLPALILAACSSAPPAQPMPLSDSVEARYERVMALPICADSLPFTGDTTGVGYHQPSVLKIILPAFNRSLRGKSFSIRHLVNTTGRVDSVVVNDLTLPDELKPFRQAAEGMRYAPANLQGCRRQGWASFKFDYP